MFPYCIKQTDNMLPCVWLAKKANTQPSEWFDERQKLYSRSKIAATENTIWAFSVYDEKLYFC